MQLPVRNFHEYDETYTGITDTYGNPIIENDVVSIIHEGKHIKEREFRYIVKYLSTKAAFVLIDSEVKDCGYLGDVLKNPNFIRWTVIGNFISNPTLLNNVQGHEPGSILLEPIKINPMEELLKAIRIVNGREPYQS